MHTPSKTLAQQVLELAQHKGVLRACDLEASAIPRVVLARLIATDQLKRVSRGLYRLPDAPSSELESLVTIARRVPQGVICLLSALQFHGLTTQLPREVWIAMPRGSHVPLFDYPPLRMIQGAPHVFRLGIEHVVRDQVPLQIYSAARTVADCFKFRSRIGVDVAIDALRDALTFKKATADEIWEFAKAIRVANVIRPYLESVQ